MIETGAEVRTGRATLDPELLARPGRCTVNGGIRKKPPMRSDGLDSPQQHGAPQAEIIAIIEARHSAWSAPDLAELLGCSGKHIYALAKSGRMPHLRIDGMIRFDPAATARWLRERFIAA